MRLLRVSIFLADSIQQIHSLRAKGVMSSQVASAALSEVNALHKSAGSLWTTPPEIDLVDMCELQRFKRLGLQSNFQWDGTASGVRTWDL